MAKAKPPVEPAIWISAGFTWRSKHYPPGTPIDGVPADVLANLIASGHVVQKTVSETPAGTSGITE